MARLIHKKQYVIQKNEGTGEYFIEGWPCAPTRVTSLVAEYFPVFDADAVLGRMDRSKGKYKGACAVPWYIIKRLRKKREGMTAEQCKEQWRKKGDEAREAGTALHFFIKLLLEKEDFLMMVAPQIEQEAAKEAVKRIEADFGSFISAEVPICTDEELLLAGTFDALFFTKGDELLLIDWKRAENLLKWTPDKGIKVMSDHNATQLVKYSLQLHLYKYILENFYRLHVNGAERQIKIVPYICHFKSGTSIFRLIPALDFRSEAEEIMKDQRAKAAVVRERLRALKRGAPPTSLPSSEEKKSDE